MIVARPNSRCGAGATSPPSASRHQLHAVADAEHRHAGVEHAPARSAARPARTRSSGPPDRMMPAGRRARDLGQRRVERQNLGVDRQLAQPARDQLRELRAEIENDDGLVSHGGEGDRAIIRCALRGGPQYLVGASPESRSPRARPAPRRRGRPTPAAERPDSARHRAVVGAERGAARRRARSSPATSWSCRSGRAGAGALAAHRAARRRGALVGRS